MVAGNREFTEFLFCYIQEKKYGFEKVIVPGFHPNIRHLIFNQLGLPALEFWRNRVAVNRGITEMLFENTEFIKIFRQTLPEPVPKLYHFFREALDPSYQIFS